METGRTHNEDRIMRIIRRLTSRAALQRGGVATIGNFDGVHRGHQAMLALLRARQAEHGGAVSVLCFEPHPREHFAPAQAPRRITPFRDKALALSRLGCDQLLCLAFDDRLAALSAEAFVDTVLVQGLGVRHLVIGDDFRFGAARRGDFALLERLGARCGFSVEGTPTELLDGQRISSTRVRAALAQGDLAEAERLLGRPYSLSGRVGHGDRIGRTLGFPTANLRLRRAPVLDGVLVADVVIMDGPAASAGQPLPAVVSIGTRPTVDGRRPVLEVHLLDWTGDLYGQHLEVRFLAWLRGQERYPSLDALTAQMERDRAATRDWFRRRDRAGQSRSERHF